MNIASYGGRSSEAWRDAKPRHHLKALGDMPRQSLKALRAHGWKPCMVGWVHFQVGLPEDLTLNKPGWWDRTTSHRALHDIWLERADHFICLELHSGLVWKGFRQGCSYRKQGEPRTQSEMTNLPNPQTK